jgi:hypothetical protein
MPTSNVTGHSIEELLDDVKGMNGKWKQRRASEHLQDLKNQEELEKKLRVEAEQRKRMPEKTKQQQEAEAEENRNRKELFEREKKRLSMTPVTCGACCGTGVCGMCVGSGCIWQGFYRRTASGCAACGGMKATMANGNTVMGTGKCHDCCGSGEKMPTAAEVEALVAKTCEKTWHHPTRELMEIHSHKAIERCMSESTTASSRAYNCVADEDDIGSPTSRVD